jgi:hypothetical protein
MALYNFTDLTYVVLHGDNGFVQYAEVGPNAAVETPHIVESFTDESEAKARAEELGYVFDDPTGNL